jgi:hypothetical protein
MTNQFPLNPSLMERYSQDQQSRGAAVKPITAAPIPSSPPPQGSSNNPRKFPATGGKRFGRIGKKSGGFGQ